LWHGERRCVLAYRTAAVAPGGPFAVIELVGCSVATFGYPNDEALPGHPLYAAGLRHYGLFEVHDSEWIERLSRQNRVVFPEVTPRGSSIRHFVITFHDSTFECLAEDVRGAFASNGEELRRLVAGPIPSTD
jgi:hypothetical protein